MWGGGQVLKSLVRQVFLPCEVRCLVSVPRLSTPAPGTGERGAGLNGTQAPAQSPEPGAQLFCSGASECR